MNVAELQRRLSALGFDPGPIDGVYGRRTIAAVKTFQKAKGLTVDGIVGPQTIAALAEGNRPAFLPWMEEINRRKGLHETRNRTSLISWLRSDGRTLGDPAKLPWCGDAVETPIALTLPDEPLPANPYLARNWMKFGRACKPTYGAVLVFWRGDRHGTSGHVGFYEGEDASAYHVLGGNQSNAITVARLAKDRLLGARWPLTVPLPQGGAIMKAATGALSTNEA